MSEKLIITTIMMAIARWRALHLAHTRDVDDLLDEITRAMTNY